MKQQLVAIHDRAAAAYGRPFCTPALGQAIRTFSDEVNRPAENNEMNRHPEDFDLYHLGEYDDNTAKIEMLDAPKQIAIGKNCKLT